MSKFKVQVLPELAAKQTSRVKGSRFLGSRSYALRDEGGKVQGKRSGFGQIEIRISLVETLIAYGCHLNNAVELFRG